MLATYANKNAYNNNITRSVTLLGSNIVIIVTRVLYKIISREEHFHSAPPCLPGNLSQAHKLIDRSDKCASDALGGE